MSPLPHDTGLPHSLSDPRCHFPQRQAVTIGLPGPRVTGRCQPCGLEARGAPAAIAPRPAPGARRQVVSMTDKMLRFTSRTGTERSEAGHRSRERRPAPPSTARLSLSSLSLKWRGRGFGGVPGARRLTPRPCWTRRTAARRQPFSRSPIAL